MTTIELFGSPALLRSNESLDGSGRACVASQGAVSSNSSINNVCLRSITNLNNGHGVGSFGAEIEKRDFIHRVGNELKTIQNEATKSKGPFISVSLLKVPIF